MRLLGVDFTSRPSRRKAITVAHATLDASCRDPLAVERVTACADFASFEALLRGAEPFVGAFDFPFGLPRAFVEATPGVGATYLETLDWLARTPRDAMRDAFRAYCAPRPVGDRFAHRATDRLAGSSPSMKWVNPPVAYMLKEGAPRLVAAGLALPGLHAGDPTRVALEAYPGMLARALSVASYKSDERHDPRGQARAEVRVKLVAALRAGALGVRVELDPDAEAAMIADASGDRLDAVLCAVHAALAVRAPGYGLPDVVDPLEGAIPLAGQFPRAAAAVRPRRRGLSAGA